METKRRKLLDNLKKDVYCRLGISKIPNAGIGILAIKPIPKGTNPFQTVDDDCREDQLVYLSEVDLKSLNPQVRKYLRDFFLSNDKNGLYAVSQKGLNAMDVSFYLNHSDRPNIELVAKPGCPFYEFQTKRRIKSGEELTFDYQGANGLGKSIQ